MSMARRNQLKMYPETGAGGFSRFDGSLEFFSRLNSLISPNFTVLDFGAGRGRQLEDGSGAPFVTRLARLQGRVRKIVGVDIDKAVLENRYLDEKFVVSMDAPLPFEDASFDLIYSDWVLEHVEDPRAFAGEVRRLLKPGGWFCARTPNRWGLTGIVTNLIPNRFHNRILRYLQPDRRSEDVFPTAYKLNSRNQVRRYFSRESWEDFSYIHSPEFVYARRIFPLFLLSILYSKLAPDQFGLNLHVFLQKKKSVGE